MDKLELQLPPLPNPQVGFIASLSDGQTIVENKGDWCWLEGLKSPWQRLVRYTAENKLLITSLSLYTPLGTTFTLPTIGGKPRFKGYTNLTPEEQPIDYEVKRFIAQEHDVGVKMKKAEVKKTAIEEFYTIAEAIYKEHILQIWVSEINLNHSWTVYKKT